MLDPLILKLVSIGFGLLLLLAAVHKLTALPKFRATLTAYEIMPGALIAPASILVPIVEALLGAAWLFNIAPTFVAMTTAALLGSYLFAIAINLLRGRIHIDCGCTMGTAAGRDQQLSWGLVARNSILIYGRTDRNRTHDRTSHRIGGLRNAGGRLAGYRIALRLPQISC